VSKLGLAAAGRLELDELSALCHRSSAERGDEILAVGDSSFQIVRGDAGSLQDRGASPDLRDALAGRTDETEDKSQWEGVAVDGAGTVFVLQEHAGDDKPSHVFVIADDLGSVSATIALHVGAGDAGWKKRWREDPNARGEGLVLLRDGHILVIKQKEPKRLIEFGPPAHSANGVGTERYLAPDEPFALDAGTDLEYHALESWGLEQGDHDRLDSLNDVAVADGELYVLSRSSRRIARLRTPLAPEADAAEVEHTWEVPRKIDCPEGLVFVNGTTPIVADDQVPKGKPRDNVFRLEPLPPPTR
jgi:hypothetical protein